VVVVASSTSRLLLLLVVVLSGNNHEALFSQYIHCSYTNPVLLMAARSRLCLIGVFSACLYQSVDSFVSQSSLGVPDSNAGISQRMHFYRQPTRLLINKQRHAILSSTIAGNDSPEERDDVKKIKRNLTKDFLAIGVPAFIQLAAEPLASLVDTAYLGRLGPEILGGAGVAISAQYAVSKLYNDPLLRTSISLVSSKNGKKRGLQDDDNADESLSVEVSSALLLALVVGVVQLVVYTVLAKAITLGMGVNQSSPMWYSAVSYLRVRALGTPAATLWLVTNGIFRGLGDTRTPLIFSLLFTALNAILDPLFIFTFHFGASGAAAGTAIAQYTALIPLMLALNKKVKIDVVGQLDKLKDSLKAYLSAGSFVLLRTLGKVFAYSVCAREAVRAIFTMILPNGFDYIDLTD